MQILKNYFWLVITIIAFIGCQEQITDRFMVNVPVYMDRQSFKKSVKVSPSSEIKEPGKIYFKDDFIFINEALKGIHVIDNTNPSSPVFVSFIEIPGNMDMAIKDSILYADSFEDLVLLNISDLNNIYETARLDSIFPYTLPPLQESRFPMGEVDASQGIVVGWETREVETVVTSNPSNWRFFGRVDFMAEDISVNSKVNTTTNGSNSMSVGIGGSMARFTIRDNYLYTVDRYNLRVFDIDELSSPLLASDQGIGWNVETLFPYKNKLFFGTQTGMLIYDLSNPAVPAYVSSYTHMKSCDPVVVEGNYAYVTLRAGNLCGEATSQLDVIDISDLNSPKLEESYPMQEPYGLGIDGKTLFVCDGEAGLKVYDASHPENLVKITGFEDVNAFDVIPFNGVLMMIGRDGLYQYDYSGPANMSLLSYIPIGEDQ